MKKYTYLLLPVLIAGCGGSSDSTNPVTGNPPGSGDAAALAQLEERITTGRNIITTSNWMCEFLGGDGNAQFTDEYGFYVDKKGTANDGFFDWSASSPNSIYIEKSGLNNFTYSIQEIAFTTASFTDDGFTATVNGQYFDSGIIESFPVRCRRDAMAVF